MKSEDKTPFDEAFPRMHTAMDMVHDMLDKLETGETASIIIR
jgi:hypothetical protein